jgi:hypothetical protein
MAVRKLKKLAANLGKLFIDGSKLCFGSLVLGTVIRGEIAHSTLLLVGVLASAVPAVVGLVLTSILED